MCPSVPRQLQLEQHRNQVSLQDRFLLGLMMTTLVLDESDNSHDRDHVATENEDIVKMMMIIIIIIRMNIRMIMMIMMMTMMRMSMMMTMMVIIM